MFLKYTGMQYQTGGNPVRDSFNKSEWSVTPMAATGIVSGAGVVAQYLSCYRNRMSAFQRLDDAAKLEQLRAKACQLDQAYAENACDLPTLKGLLDAAADLGYVKNAGTAFFCTKDAFKYYSRDYGAVICEFKLTTSTYNAHSFEITGAGSSVSDDVTKGFVCFGYDADGVLLQNTLSPSSGSLGFNKMTWAAFEQLFVQGACFTV